MRYLKQVVSVILYRAVGYAVYFHLGNFPRGITRSQPFPQIFEKFADNLKAISYIIEHGFGIQLRSGHTQHGCHVFIIAVCGFHLVHNIRHSHYVLDIAGVSVAYSINNRCIIGIGVFYDIEVVQISAYVIGVNAIILIYGSHIIGVDRCCNIVVAPERIYADIAAVIRDIGEIVKAGKVGLQILAFKAVVYAVPLVVSKSWRVSKFRDKLVFAVKEILI